METAPLSSATTSPPIRATVFVGRWPAIPAEPGEVPPGTFSPTTATIISGATEAVLIDALHLKDEVQALGDLIERTGKRLTTIYITHDHADHYLGFGPLLERFPEARCVTLPSILNSMKETMEFQKQQWKMFFGDECVMHGPLPEPMVGNTLYVDGSPLNIIEVKQADIHPTSIVHVPEIDVVVAGDAIYNEIYPMLALSTLSEWQDWLETVKVVEELRPRMIVAGHRRPDGDDYAVEAMISQTRAYIQDFAAAYDIAKDVADLVTIMATKYPHHGNLWSLQVSAAFALERRSAASAAEQ
ncbi:MBL fold metallo-hydrolase [Nonomuraea basaltis]|uniref:MBL fold metallo-hydrolase n=1 Tax=Nonomuraea basaltis TaxID=2495887 RepID=UPI00110C58A3|nr:MBL fold metallo-hydrolase [Nonomuraea basaltis]TMR93317.1 MBL fold metallo-hydrolase [Nonomuraea basaltis]